MVYYSICKIMKNFSMNKILLILFKNKVNHSVYTVYNLFNLAW